MYRLRPDATVSDVKRMLIALAIAVLMAPITALPGRAAEPDPPDHIVHAGAIDPRDPRSMHMFEGFFPGRLQVHRGDHVRWLFPNQVHIAQAFHTVTFGDPSAVPYVRADEAPGTLAFDERAFFTTGCGRPGQPVCVISSRSKLVSSGTPLQHFGDVGKIQPFDAVIDLPVGTYTYFCTLHHPKMVGTIEVVPDDVELRNRKPSDYSRELAKHAAHADATFAALAQPALSTADGRRVWTVHAGAGTTGAVRVSTEAFLPASLSIRAGDTVRWVMGGTAHAVTFPDTTLGRPPLHLTLNCEFDEPASGALGVPLIAAGGPQGLPWCPPGGSAEMTLTALAASEVHAHDDAVVSPATVHSSGIMIHGALPERMRGRPAGSGAHFPSVFEATFPVAGTYTYRCMIHSDFMTGSITVR
jgi:plastocyanin